MSAILRTLSVLLPCLGMAVTAGAQEPDKAEGTRVQVERFLEAQRQAHGFPAASAAWIGPGSLRGAVTVGRTDEKGLALLTPDHLLLSGSIGKTYVSALVLRLVDQGLLALDAPILEYLGDLEWVARLPNARDLTLRLLLRHQSGIREHVWNPSFHEAVLADPDRRWTATQLLDYALDQPALFAAGEGWSYADTNYLVVGLVCEQVTGTTVEALLKEHLFEPFGLEHTVCSNRRDIEGLANGFASGLILHEGPTVVDGRYFVNPGFEWCGGGVASTTSDLALWCQQLFAGEVIPEALQAEHRGGVPADPRVAALYGLGVMLDESPHGPRWGHEGIMPGYLSAMAWYPEHQLAVAIQFNTDGGRLLGRSLSAWTDLLVPMVLPKDQVPAP